MSTDPIAARSPTLVRFTSRYMRRFMQRNFHAVRMAKPGPAQLPPDRPVIVYCNHPAWWDPAFIIVLASTYFPNRLSYGPMDSAALGKYGFMRRIGLFGVEPGTRRGAAQFLRISLRILQQSDAVLWITAEGAFTDARVRPVRLQPGVAALMRRVPNAVCVPLAIEYPLWNERYSEALCRFGEPLDAGEVADARQTLEARLTETMDRLAAEAITRDPSRFDTVLEGAVGIGGIYDVWRRLKALVHRQGFNAAHGDPD
jgi:1-acyl-sn-glycerol-3-phosphate acyltransferase